LPAPIEPDVIINGAMHGSIIGHSDVKVDINGHCEGTLNARELNIFGTVVGDVCVDELIVHPTGRFYYGQVTAKNTVIHDGAVYVERKTPAAPKILPPTLERTEESETKRKTKSPNFVITY